MLWRQLLLGYLPTETAQWPMVLAHKRAAYAQFCAELIVDPKDADGGGGGGGAAAPAADHPLSQSSDSRWHAFFKVRYGGLRQHASGHEFCTPQSQKRGCYNFPAGRMVQAKQRQASMFTVGMTGLAAKAPSSHHGSWHHLMKGVGACASPMQAGRCELELVR